MQVGILVLMIMTGLASQWVQAQSSRHALWDALLKQYLVEVDEGRVTRVDCAGLLSARSTLQQYLESLSQVTKIEYLSWSKAEQLAFLINGYNAWTVDLILSKYPELNSIRDLGSFIRPVWKRDFIPLFGEMVSLDDIEHGMIRGKNGFGEPRIHFAVNCASIGCPALRREAYTPENLERQLEEATHQFLADNSRNRLEDDTLYVSKIFDWYKEDFRQGWRGVDSVAEFLSRYGEALALPDTVKNRLRDDDFRIRFLEYDWSLNDAGW